MMLGGGQSDIGNRLVVELFNVHIVCDDCGHSRTLYLSNLRKAAELGVQNYRELCWKIRCSECPPQPPHARNLSITPYWRCEPLDHTLA